MTNSYDVGIIGMGVAGTFACLKLSKESDIKIICFDIGRPPQKRRQQLCGFLGCLPNSDGKFYLSDIDKVAEITGRRKAKSAFTQTHNILNNIEKFKINKDTSPNSSMKKKLIKSGFDISLNDYIQIYPKDIHLLSKYISTSLEDNNQEISYSFDNEVKSITKQKNMFIISSEQGDFKCKKLIISVGRSGWRWVSDLYKNFGIIDNNDYATFGVRVELNSSYMKDFNKSNCTLKKNDVQIGPFNWYGTVIPEDHVDLAISSFRSNENRWKTDKVSFSLISNRLFPKSGYEQTDRLAKLAFILANDRIVREKVSTFLNNKSKISVIPEYKWVKDQFNELCNLVPEIQNKGYFHFPTILTAVPKINISNDLSTEIEGLYVAGESAGCQGLTSAACMGIIAGDSICKG